MLRATSPDKFDRLLAMMNLYIAECAQDGQRCFAALCPCQAMEEVPIAALGITPQLECPICHRKLVGVPLMLLEMTEEDGKWVVTDPLGARYFDWLDISSIEAEHGQTQTTDCGLRTME